MPLIRGTKGISVGAQGDAILIGLTAPDIFVAKITSIGPAVSIDYGRSGGSWSGSGSGSVDPSSTVIPYGWHEQRISATGLGYVDMEGGRFGTTSGATLLNPAFELNDNPLSVGQLVWMRQRGFVSSVDSQIVYECMAGGGAGSSVLTIEVLTDVTFSGCSLTKTYQTIHIPGGYIA